MSNLLKHISHQNIYYKLKSIVSDLFTNIIIMIIIIYNEIMIMNIHVHVVEIGSVLWSWVVGRGYKVVGRGYQVVGRYE